MGNWRVMEFQLVVNEFFPKKQGIPRAIKIQRTQHLVLTFALKKSFNGYKKWPTFLVPPSLWKNTS